MARLFSILWMCLTDIYPEVPASAELLDLSDLLDYLPRLASDGHKTQRGHSMIVGGDRGYGGAAIMAAEACLKTGAGMTSLATRPEHVAPMLVRQPEVMASPVVSGQELEPLLERPDMLVVGPGLGRSSWSEQLLQKAVAAGLPMVLDADGLNILAEGRVVANPDGSQWVLTPHAGEAARLLGHHSGRGAGRSLCRSAAAAGKIWRSSGAQGSGHIDCRPQ